MDIDRIHQWLPIAVSILLLIITGIALGWNIYRDVILKARVNVNFAIISQEDVKQARKKWKDDFFDDA